MRYQLSPLFLVCYDGEDAAAQAAAATAAAKASNVAKADAAATDAAAAAVAVKNAVTKEQVEKLLSDERKKADTKLKAALADKESALSDLLATKDLTAQQRTEYEAKLDEVQKQTHTEKELLLKEKKKVEDTLNTRIKEAEKVANDWRSRYSDSTINRELQEAAVKGEAVNPKQLVALLKANTKTVEVEGVYKTVVEVEKVVDGKTVTEQVTPEEAVNQMKAKPEEYGNLFKAGGVSGLGGNSGTNTQATLATVDMKNLTHEQYMLIRANLLKSKK